MKSVVRFRIALLAALVIAGGGVLLDAVPRMRRGGSEEAGSLSRPSQTALRLTTRDAVAPTADAVRVAPRAASRKEEPVNGARPSPRRTDTAAKLPSTTVPAGMVVAVDPETGELVMPTPEQLAELAAQRVGPESAVTPVVTRHPDGSLSIEVRDQIREYTVVRTDRRGKLVPGCSADRDAMAREAADASPARDALEEE